MGKKSKWDEHLPLNISLGTNYKTTLRFTDFLHGNATAKIVEKHLEEVLVVKKWGREKEVAVFNRTIYYEDHYKWDNKSKEQRMSHHKKCVAIGKANESSVLPNATANVLGLSPQMTNGTGLNGEGIGQLLALLERIGGGWNGTLHSDKLLTNGIETIGYTGCKRNFTGDRTLRLQIELEYAADMTPQQPYSPHWHNPSLYTIRVLTYDVDGNSSRVYDYFSADIVTLDAANGENKELIATPPRGVFCEGMPNSTLPIQFPHPFVVHFRMFHTNKSHHGNATLYDEAVVYDGTSKITGILTSNPDQIVVHDFAYGLQYHLDFVHHGKCGQIGPISAELADVGRNANGTMYLRPAEDLIIWMGKLNEGITKPQFYHAGKVQIGDELLDSYVSRFAHPFVDGFVAQNDSAVVVVEVLLANLTIGNVPSDAIRSVVHYTKSGRTNAEFIVNRVQQLNAWQTLAGKLRGCVKKTTADSAWGYFVRMGNVTLSELNAQIGMEWAKAAVAKALADAANISLIRIVDLNLEESNDGTLYAFFAIGAPSGAIQAQTIYLMKEITVAEAVQSLNASVVSGKFAVRIPLSTEAEPNTELVFSGTQFSKRSSPLPHPCPPPAPSPSPQFIGFSGSTLAIVAIFCFISGAFFIAGAYIVHQKRQYIRGMAYQVFE
ncbi:hypothetical protein niasHT_021951 [Heterodera trifolii]|uniref:Uncharacterized protein n=1 Tax=Heterodera trifolii TaxID=157864 RepID=A0ABD2K053_9BILA